MNLPEIYVECGADLNAKYPFTRKHFMPPHETDRFRKKYNNQGVYQTVMQYIDPVWMIDHKQKRIINAKESLKYGDFYLDFDHPLEKEEDFDKIKDDVSMALKYMKVIMSIDLDQINIYYSGHKGIHITIDPRVLGVRPHIALNQIYKEVAREINQYCKHNTLDLRVYDDKRMFRMVNSLNLKGQLYKIPLTYEEFKNLSLREIRRLATQPREIKKPLVVFSSQANRVFEEIAKKWTEKIQKRNVYAEKIKKLKKPPACIQAMLNKVFHETVDERNNSGTALTSFFMQQGYSYEETLSQMMKWSQENCVPPLEQREIETIVQSVYTGQYRYGCETFHKLSGVCERDTCPLFK